jgi:predicted TIM-barrel fold metal-dependent hydrolase
MQEHYAMTGNMQGTVASLVFEGVFERFPGLKVVLIEGGFAWAPALCWRMDKHWERLRQETPQVKRPPSEYVREHIWFTTQPIEEPDDPQHLADVIERVGWDRLMFSTDYPHWDYDDPQQVFRFKASDAEKARVLRDNAKALYGLS